MLFVCRPFLESYLARWQRGGERIDHWCGETSWNSCCNPRKAENNPLLSLCQLKDLDAGAMPVQSGQVFGANVWAASRLKSVVVVVVGRW